MYGRIEIEVSVIASEEVRISGVTLKEGQR